MGLNPRYIRYATVHGNTPEEQMEKDKVRWPGGCMCGFILWIDQAMRAFLAPYGGNKLDLPLKNTPDFDEFLATYKEKLEGGGNNDTGT